MISGRTRAGFQAEAWTSGSWGETGRPFADASNEFGEGGYIAPTRGEGMMKLQTIGEVYGR